ncbi:MAG: hypothetical protein ACXVGN_06440 [Mycobacteriaceae bacterium]
MELPELLVADAPAWREWLEQHHADSPTATQFVEMLARGETVYPQKPG